MDKCTWCQKELKIANCDFWDNEEKVWKLRLCDECHKKRFDLFHQKTILVSLLKEFISKLEK